MKNETKLSSDEYGFDYKFSLKTWPKNRLVNQNIPSRKLLMALILKMNVNSKSFFISKRRRQFITLYFFSYSSNHSSKDDDDSSLPLSSRVLSPTTEDKRGWINQYISFLWVRTSFLSSGIGSNRGIKGNKRPRYHYWFCNHWFFLTHEVKGGIKGVRDIEEVKEWVSIKGFSFSHLILFGRKLNEKKRKKIHGYHCHSLEKMMPVSWWS